ncbi:hypothetical protein Tco_0978878 [Tanacetum coccineum]|uniref:Uncharacterized protein n=1 Tax=Tanacetum coccineum TaxID=301880 RepID=A0ABQ5EP85_9ASTR
MLNPEDISDLTTAMNMTLVLIAKAFKLNYYTPTNNNQRISSNLCNMQIAQPCMNMGQDRPMQMAGVHNLAVQNVGNQNGLIVVPRIANLNVNQNRNGLLCNTVRNYTVKPRRRDVAYLHIQLLITQKEESRDSTQSLEFELMPLRRGFLRDQEQCLTKKINALHLSSAKMITTLNEEIANLNNQLSKEKSTVSFLNEEKKKLKSDFKIHEDELLDKQIQLEKKIKELDNILVKMGQSIQTMHMLSPKPYSFYHTEQKMALGYQNPFYLKQAQ